MHRTLISKPLVIRATSRSRGGRHVGCAKALRGCAVPRVEKVWFERKATELASESAYAQGVLGLDAGRLAPTSCWLQASHAQAPYRYCVREARPAFTLGLEEQGETS